MHSQYLCDWQLVLGRALKLTRAPRSVSSSCHPAGARRVVLHTDAVVGAPNQHQGRVLRAQPLSVVGSGAVMGCLRAAGVQECAFSSGSSVTSSDDMCQSISFEARYHQ
jgi:hypothetical protein